jgi:hypothetical protein
LGKSRDVAFVEGATAFAVREPAGIKAVGEIAARRQRDVHRHLSHQRPIAAIQRQRVLEDAGDTLISEHIDDVLLVHAELPEDGAGQFRRVMDTDADILPEWGVGNRRGRQREGNEAREAPDQFGEHGVSEPRRRRRAKFPRGKL